MDGLSLHARWAECGGMWLTGPADGEALARPAAIAGAFDEWATRLTPWVQVDGAALIGERAAIAGLQRQGTTSCGGATRLLATVDGWVALTMSRESDIGALSALFGEPIDGLDWLHVERCARACTSSELREQGVLLGLPIGVLGERADTGPLVEREPIATRDRVECVADLEGCLVVDLSAMWAGPLCGNLLTLAGARVVKVESRTRPDGARSGPSELFDLLHAEQRSVSIDFTSSEGQEELRALVRDADVVIESSRPRALRALRAGFDDLRNEEWRGVWVAITAHGNDSANEMRVGFGDDAAVAGGLVAWHEDRPVFCADAIADPATGLLAAAEVFEALAAGWCGRLSMSLARTAAYLAGRVAADVRDATDIGPVLSAQPPRSRVPTGRAAALGQHDAAVFGR